ncbi:MULTISPECIES: class I SAM-dependent methyltransferase [unclassified Pseudodesulfovibrio]|uniref:class I SAM-dependent methyltransferase n=1 Tax=unclassified Pseudodesulfovibrio TaxID=2661612 RepID=UPI000FEBF9BD|nr:MULTISPECIES: class I SAM-dependent methyltransferase [unclassified Pseudodesulfovibrio]MCJ2163209.1 class I SAM-dependent methyltransferase [Pseudodesulfovibrio sp. S3-i]RWU07192.1 methyltransferase domain-containing protein [Pseudodesulfovibrio sp. S3]
MNCRHCNTPLEHLFIDLGEHPPSNSFVTANRLSEPEPKYPLKVYTCSNCFLVQVDEYKQSTEIFNEEYVYYSSYSSSWLEHAQRYADMAAHRFNLDENSLVTEIASNDGYLLQFMREKKIPCYGVEPSTATADVAATKGIESVRDFFGSKLAEQLRHERGPVDLLIGNNVLAHVPDINDFVQGIGIILREGGTATLEFPHLMRLVAERQFDTIYHEHFSYLSLNTVGRILSRAGLRIFDVEELPTHGGSLRVFICHEDDARETGGTVTEILGRESAAGMNTLPYYDTFQAGADAIRDDLLEFLREKKREGKSVAAYGAAAKGNTLLNYCGVTTDLIDFCVDASPHKQGLFMPQSHIPILAPETLKDRRPDYVLILPWNIKNEILRQHGYIADWGGSFFTAIPELHTI